MGRGVRTLCAGAFALAVLAGSVSGRPGVAQAAPGEPYIVDVQDVTARVGEHAVMHITLRLPQGYRVLEHYTNRVSRFSSLDGGVTFDDKVVPGRFEDGVLTFAVGVTPTTPGRHPINGVFRVGYIQGPDSMSMISVPLIANVIGADQR
jgi:hypothetical protein